MKSVTASLETHHGAGCLPLTPPPLRGRSDDRYDTPTTASPNDPLSDNVIEPNDSDHEGDDLSVSKVTCQPIDSDGLSTITLPSGAVVTINFPGVVALSPLLPVVAIIVVIAMEILGLHPYRR